MIHNTQFTRTPLIYGSLGGAPAVVVLVLLGNLVMAERRAHAPSARFDGAPAVVTKRAQALSDRCFEVTNCLVPVRDRAQR